MDEHSDLDDWELLSDSGEINGVVEASIQSNYFFLNFTEPSETVVMQPELEEEKHEDLHPDPIFHISDDYGSDLVDVKEFWHGEPIEMVGYSEDAEWIGEQSPFDVGIAEVFSAEDGVDLGRVDEELRSSEPEMIEGGAEDGADLRGVDEELRSSEPEMIEGGTEDGADLRGVDEELRSSEPEMIEGGAENEADARGVDPELNSSEPEEVEVEAEDGGRGNDSGSNGLPVTERENEGMVWWRVPMEMVKHCVRNVSPVWCLPVVATVFGLAIVGTRMYMMKHQNQSRQQSRIAIPLRVSMDQQKAYQVMVRARLNEACTVTRRVPVIRSSQHHDGAISWPIVSLT